MHVEVTVSIPLNAVRVDVTNSKPGIAELVGTSPATVSWKVENTTPGRAFSFGLLDKPSVMLAALRPTDSPECEKPNSNYVENEKVCGVLLVSADPFLEPRDVYRLEPGEIFEGSANADFLSRSVPEAQAPEIAKELSEPDKVALAVCPTNTVSRSALKPQKSLGRLSTQCHLFPVDGKGLGINDLGLID